MSKRIIVSDHAKVRYFERILGIDMDAVDEIILPKKKRRSIKKDHVSRSYPIYNSQTGDTHWIRVKDGCVVTLLPNHP